MRERTCRLSEKHDHKRSRDGWQCQCDPGIYQLPGGKHLEQGDHDRYERKHHCQQQNTHQNILALIMIDLKSITGNGTDQQCHNRDHDRIAEGIKHCKSEILHVDQGLEILDHIGTRDQASSYHINTLVSRAAQHIIQRKC